jgi:hypothetical protein
MHLLYAIRCMFCYFSKSAKVAAVRAAGRRPARGGRGGTGRPGRAKPKSATDLDNELDAFMGNENKPGASSESAAATLEKDANGDVEMA